LTFWLLLLAFVVLILVGANAVRRTSLSDEEYERESKRPSVLGTAMQGLQGFLEPERKAAMHAVQEEKRKTQSNVSGDPPSPGEKPDH